MLTGDTVLAIEYHKYLCGTKKPWHPCIMPSLAQPALLIFCLITCYLGKINEIMQTMNNEYT